MASTHFAFKSWGFLRLTRREILHHMNYRLNSLKGDYAGDSIGNYDRGCFGEILGLDYSSHVSGVLGPGVVLTFLKLSGT